jgi:hypothetical protein
MPSKSPWGSLTQQISKISLRGGLATKICYVLIFIAIALAMICWAVKSEWVAVIAIVSLFLLSLVILWRLINLAEKAPQAALLEGAELLDHQRMLIGTKATPEVLVKSQDVVPPVPQIPQQSTDSPDPEKTPRDDRKTSGPAT